MRLKYYRLNSSVPFSCTELNAEKTPSPLIMKKLKREKPKYTFFLIMSILNLKTINV